jgi:alpha-L-rhamnosidase
MYGAIRSAWEIRSDKFTLRITVPVNTAATVYVPQGGGPIRKSEYVRFLRVEDNYSVYDVDSGAYEFVSQLPPKETK